MCAPLGLIDTQLDKACSIALASDDMARCVPSANSVVSTFSDSACSQPIDAVTQQTCEEKPFYAYRSFDGSCGSGRELFGVAANTIDAYSGTVDLCTINSGQSYLAVSGAVDPSGFAMAALEHEGRAGRLDRML